MKVMATLQDYIGCQYETHGDTKKCDLSDDDIVTLVTVQQFLRETNDKVAEKLANDIDKILEEHIT